MNPIPDSELIQISRGYAIFLVLALVYSAIIGPRKLNHGYTLKFFAVFFLIVGAALDVPKTVWNGLASMPIGSRRRSSNFWLTMASRTPTLMGASMVSNP